MLTRITQTDKDLIVGLFLSFVFLTLLYEVSWAPDTKGYINFTSMRPPVYPLLLKLFSYLDSSYWFLVFFQMLFGLSAIVVTTLYAASFFELNQTSRIALGVILATPYIGKTGNYLLTEAIAYPLFLFTVCSLLALIKHNKFRHFIGLLALIMTLSLIRGQFVFLYVVAFLYVLFCIYKSIKINYFISLVVLFLGILGQNYAERYYHYKFDNGFNNTSHTNIHLSVAPLYLSNIEDAKAFEDGLSKSIFTSIKQDLDEKKLGVDYRVGNINVNYQYYTVYDKIVYDVIANVFNDYEITAPHEVDEIMGDIYLHLVKHKPFAYAKHVFKNAVGYFGGYYQLVFFFCVALIVFTKSTLDSDNSNLFKAAMFLMLLHFGNILLLSIVQAVHVRYSFYTDIIFWSFCIVFSTEYYLKLKRQVDNV